MQSTQWEKVKAQGLCGTRTEPTWSDRAHSCCGSKTWWRHLETCPRATGDGKLPPDETP